MGQHQVKSPEKPKPPRLRQVVVNLPVDLFARMKACQEKFKQDGKVPDMETCVTFWLDSFLTLFEQSARNEERRNRLVLSPDELQEMGEKIPPPSALAVK